MDASCSSNIYQSIAVSVSGKQLNMLNPVPIICESAGIMQAIINKQSEG
jgi:hypothetical protein